MSTIWNNLVEFLQKNILVSSIALTDIIDIVIIAVLFYYIMIWFKRTRAWSLLKGIIVIVIVVLLASVFQLNTILWLADKTISVGVIALVIIFQPELRRALEQLGRRNLFRSIFRTGTDTERISDHNIEEIVIAVQIMSSEHTGALICIQKDIGLGEYENTGIEIDSAISRQLLMNIFEDKTPLHDGAVIIRDDRITAATCYLPMSDNLQLNKKYGTRHRAAVGISEVTDAFTIVVSEETGAISLAESGELIEDINIAELKNRLLQFKNDNTSSTLLQRLKKGKKNDGEDQSVPEEESAE